MPAQEGYDVSWTRLRAGYFHQRVQPGTPGYLQDAASSVPGATDEYPWLSRGASITLTATIPTKTPILLADNYRNLLIIQNTSSATSPDTAPTLFVNVDGPVVLSGANSVAVTYSMAFQPGFGILMDERVLTNALYVAYGAFTNTGGSVVVGGILTYGRTPNSPPLAQMDMVVGAANTNQAGAFDAMYTGSGRWMR